MIKIKKIDGFIEIAASSKVSGPSQQSGLEFGTTYHYYRTSENGKWIKWSGRSGLQLIKLAQNSPTIKEFLGLV